MTAIEIENLSKQYALGKIGTGMLMRDLNVWWARMRDWQQWRRQKHLAQHLHMLWGLIKNGGIRYNIVGKIKRR